MNGIACIGRPGEYVTLLQRFPGTHQIRFQYGGPKPTPRLRAGKRLILLNLDLDNLAACVKDKTLEVGFFYDGYLLWAEDTVQLDCLARDYLAQKQYGMLKGLNLLRMVLNIKQQKTVLNAWPLHIQLEHTTFCNARCVMCDHYIAHNRGAAHLRLDALRRLEPLLPYASLVVMHGNGEPLLHPDILDFFALYRQYGVKTSLNTNLSQLSGPLLHAIRENCASLHISCDGCAAEQYESIRQGLDFERFQNNLDRLAREAPAVDKVLEVVLMRQNITSAVKFVDFAARYGIKKVVFHALGVNEWIGNQEDSLERFETDAMFYCQCARGQGEQLGVQVRTPFEGLPPAPAPKTPLAPPVWPDPETSQLLHEKYPWYTNTIAVSPLEEALLKPAVPIAGGVCEYPFAKTYIDLHGNVSYCCPASRQIVGTLTEQADFRAVWNGPRYQAIRERFYQGQLPALCQNCWMLRNRSLKFLNP